MVRVTTIVHATEDLGKVARTLTQLPSQEPLPGRILKTKLKGHYGNEIVTFRIILRGKSAASFFDSLSKMLPRDQWSSIILDLQSRLDENGRFHLRLNKQQAFRGYFRLTDEDPIKVEVTFSNGKASGLKRTEMIRQLIESRGKSS